MAVIGNLIVLLSANNTALTAGLLKAEGQLKAFGNTADTTSARTGAILGGIGLVAAAGLGMAVAAAASFQEQMAKVNTIAQLGEEPLAALGQQVRALSVATGVGVGDLTSGLYDLLSVGVPAGQAIELLTNATTLSIGGLSTANEAVNAITTAINSWSSATGAANLTMADSAKVTDIFAQAIAAGGMTAADIPGALAAVAAQAAMMNMPLEEVAATWAILTVRGLSASEASTSLAATLTALAKAPPGMEKLEKATGKTYLQIAKTQGVHEAVMQLVADAAKYGVVLEDVFGRKEALPFVTFTTGAGGDQLWGQALGAEFNSAGVAAAQMDKRMGTFQRQLDIFGASANDLGITLGTALLPPLTDIFDAINTGVQSVTAWAAANPQLSSSLLPIIAGVGLLAGAVALLGAPFVAIGVAIALVITHFDDLQRGVEKVLEFIKPLTDVIGPVLGAALDAVAASIAAVIQGFKDAIAFAQMVIAWAAGQNPSTGPAGGALGPGGPRGPGIGAPGPSLAGTGALVGPRGPGGGTTLNNTTNVYLDGQKLAEVVDRRQYDMYSVSSSGMSSTDHPHR